MADNIPLDGLEAEIVLNVKFADGHVLTYQFDRNGSVFDAAMREFIAHLEEML